MRFLGILPVAVAALALCTTGCGDDDSDSPAKATSTTAAATSATTLSQPTTTTSITAPIPQPTVSPQPTVPPVPPPVTTSIEPAPPGEVDCGTGVNGLEVIVISGRGAAACADALAVTNAYGEVDDWGPPVTVTANGVPWTCQERRGAVNPYQECVNQQDPNEKARLYS